MIYLLSILIANSQALVEFPQVYEDYKIEKSTQGLTVQEFTNPLYDNLQFSFRNGQFNNNSYTQNQYGIKLSPLAMGQFALEKELNGQYTKLSQRFYSEATSQSCLSKYQSFLELFYHQKSVDLFSKLTLTNEDQVTILKKGITRAIFDFGDLLKAQEKLVESKIALKNFSQKAQALLRELHMKTGKNYELHEIDFQKFIDVDVIKQSVAKFDLKNMEVEKLQTVANIRNLEMEIAKKEDEKIVDFIQLTQRENLVTDEKTYLFEVGFNITSFQKKSVADYIDQQKAQLELISVKKEAASEFKDSQSELKNLIKNYEDRMDSQYLKDLFETQKFLASSGANSPYNILQVKEKILSEQIKILDLRYDITSAYIEALFYQGLLNDCSDSYIVASAR